MHLLGTIAMILVLSLMIAGLLKLNYKDLWVSEDLFDLTIRKYLRKG